MNKRYARGYEFHINLKGVALAGATVYACVGFAIILLADETNDSLHRKIHSGGLAIFYTTAFFNIIIRSKPNPQLLVLVSWNLLRGIVFTACKCLASSSDEAAQCDAGGEDVVLIGVIHMVVLPFHNKIDLVALAGGMVYACI